MAMSPVMFNLPLTKEVPDSAQEGLVNPESAPNKAASYTIQPVVWMLVFLIVGYIGLRWIMED